MAPNSFNKQMEEYLLEIIRTGENGNIYRCLVLKTDNQKLKVRDAWTWVHDTFNLRFGTQFNKEFLRKKYSYLRQTLDNIQIDNCYKYNDNIEGRT